MKKVELMGIVTAVVLSFAVGGTASAQKPKQTVAEAEEKSERTNEKAREKDAKTTEKVLQSSGSVQSRKAIEKIERTNAKAAVKDAKTADKVEDKAEKISAKNARGRCKDGTFTIAKTRTGACSRHGGVAEWLRR